MMHPMADAPDPRAAAEWPDVRALFEACVDLGGPAREARLAAAAPAVRAECESLLAARDRAPTLLDADRDHGPLLASPAALVGVGGRIGEFRVLGVLGHGGMGTVLLAEQATPRRCVALKLLASGVAFGEAEQRFRREAELLGRLRHAGIAQVFAFGVHEQDTPLGRVRWPYFAMEYVDGAQTLAAWAAAAPRTEAAKLAAMLEVCAAVQHAHERGVVHRDLKPANVLVDPAGSIKVIDFGIARCVGGGDDVQRTATTPGELLGTLCYMSPEQARGDVDRIDTRTDVHSLGVMAFELLTGRLPFDFGAPGLPAAARVLTEVEPAPLRSALPAADTDLERILAMAMAKDPQRRYSTAGALADDLRRYQRREPIVARPPSLGYHLRLFARRRRRLVAGLAGLLVVAAAGASTSAVYAYRAGQAERRALQASERTTQAMERLFAMAMRSALELPHRLQGLPGTTAIRRDVVAQALQQLDFVERSVPIDTAMRRAMARAYLQLGEVQGGGSAGHVGDRDAAAASFARAHEHLRPLLAAGNDDAASLLVHVDLELARGRLAFDVRRDLSAADGHWDAAAAAIARMRLLPQVDGDDLRRSEAAHAACSALAAQARGDLGLAVARLQHAIELRHAGLGGQAPDAAARREIAGLWRGVAFAEDRRQQPAAARTAYLRAVELLRPADRDPDAPASRRLLALVRSELGHLLVRCGVDADGEAHLRWSQAELARLVADSPDDAALQTSFGAACHRLAEHLAVLAKEAADAAAARQHWREARDLAQAALQALRPLPVSARDMVTVFVAAECERLASLCDEHLR
jgi:uncharacterized protein with PIN domain